MEKLIVTGKILDFVLLLAMVIITLYITYLATGRKLGTVYPIPGLEAIDEAVGRAVELGRPVTMTTGFSKISNSKEAPGKLAGYAVMGHVSQLCAEKGTDFYVMYSDPAEFPIIDDVVRTGYISAGKVEDYKPENMIFSPRRVMPFEYLILMEEINVGSVFTIGFMNYETVLWSEQIKKIGAMYIAGTDAFVQLPYAIAAADYTLIGEEIYAAGAYLSKSTKMNNDIVGHDWVKYGLLAFMLLSYILVNIGFKAVSSLLSM